MTTNNPFTDTADAAEKITPHKQGRNQAWWESKPMTYVDWAASDRLPSTPDDFQQIEAYVLRTGPWLRRWFEQLELSGKSCLDIGSGSGIFSTFLTRRGASVCSMDLTEAGVALTRETTNFFEARTSVVRGDAEISPFKSSSFDFVFSWGVLHHTSNMDQAVSEMGRVLREGGRGMIMVYHKHSIVYYVHGAYWLFVKGKIFSGHTLKSVQSFYTDGYYHRYLTKNGLRNKLAKAGLETSKISVTQYEKKILPFIPDWLDQKLKSRYGMCLIAEFEKPSGDQIT